MYELNNLEELDELIEYLILKNMTHHLKMHVASDSLSTSNEETFDFENEPNLILKICPQTIVSHWKNHFNHENIGISKHLVNVGFDNEKYIDEKVFTLFNSKHSFNKLKCMILVAKNQTDYCIEFNECGLQLPFICKVKADKNSNTYQNSLNDYVQDPKMSYVINSFLAIYHGLDSFQKNICLNNTGLCDGFKNIKGLDLLKHIRQSSFLGITNEQIYFDANGDPGGRYVILNLQKDIRNESFQNIIYKEVGSWDNHFKLDLKLNEIIFPNGEKTFKSICSEPCQFGFIR